MNILKITSFAVLSAGAVLCATAAETVKYPKSDFRNYFGAGWQADGKEVISFAKRMGYSHVMAMGADMACSPDANGMYFFIETPEYGTYTRKVCPLKKYTPEQIKDWELNCALRDASKPFPENLATGWFFSETDFSAQLDFQQQKVIDRTIDRIIQNVKKYQKLNPNFKFAGFSWDVPQPFGDFWNAQQGPKHKGGQKTLAYWTGGDFSSKHPEVKHDYATYSEGYFEFLRQLRERCDKEFNMKVKFIVEPYNVYNDWMRYMEGDFIKSKPDPKKYMADFVLEENGTTDFVDDKRNFQSGLLDKAHVGSSTPNVWDEPQARNIAAAAATNGAWSTWFGRIGGTGNCPRYRYIRDVPARLKLAKLLPVWENLNGTPLSERKYENGFYTSPNAGMTESAIWAKHPESGEVYFSIIRKNGFIPVPEGYEVDEIATLDGVFQQLDGLAPNKKNRWRQKPASMNVEDGKIVPTSSDVLNMGYVVKFKKIEQK